MCCLPEVGGLTSLGVCVGVAVLKDGLLPPPFATLALVTLQSCCRIFFGFQVVMPTTDQVHLSGVQSCMCGSDACVILWQLTSSAFLRQHSLTSSAVMTFRFACLQGAEAGASPHLQVQQGWPLTLQRLRGHRPAFLVQKSGHIQTWLSDSVIIFWVPIIIQL